MLNVFRNFNTKKQNFPFIFFYMSKIYPSCLKIQEFPHFVQTIINQVITMTDPMPAASVRTWRYLPGFAGGTHASIMWITWCLAPLQTDGFYHRRHNTHSIQNIWLDLASNFVVWSEQNIFSSLGKMWGWEQSKNFTGLQGSCLLLLLWRADC